MLGFCLLATQHKRTARRFNYERRGYSPSGLYPLLLQRLPHAQYQDLTF